MPEVHTCTCGGQIFKIHDGTLTCINIACGKTYGLNWLDDEMESSGEFNERIKKEG